MYYLSDEDENVRNLFDNSRYFLKINVFINLYTLLLKNVELVKHFF